jgi:hypothetical protein
MSGSVERHGKPEIGQPSPSRRAQGKLSDEYFANCQRHTKMSLYKRRKEIGKNLFIPRVDQEEWT